MTTTTTTPDIDLAAAGWVYKAFAPLDDSGLTPLPASLLPDSIYGLVTATQIALEVPAEMAFACCLGVASAVCQTRWCVKIKDGWTVPLSLYIALLADPGEMKSPTLGPIVKPVYDFEAEDRERADSENASNATVAKIKAGQVKAMEADAIKTGDTSDETMRRIDDLKSEIPRTEKPKRLLVNDVTPEHLLRLMSENDGAIAAITDEAGSFLKSMSGRYSGGQANIDGILTGWDNGPIRVDRANGNNVMLDRGRITLTMLMQKHLAREVLGNDEFAGRGLVDRFLWMVPSNSKRGYRNFDGEPIPGNELDAWAWRIKALLAWSPAETTERGTTAHVIELTEAARSRHRRYHLAIERQLRFMDESDPRLGYRQKWAGQVVRLAGVLHCLEMAAGDSPPHAKPITDDAMAGAIAIASVLLDQADAALGMVGQDPRIERARRIVQRMKGIGVPTTTANLWRSMCKGRKLFEDKTQFDYAIEMLFNRGYLASLEDGKTTHITLTPPALEAP